MSVQHRSSFKILAGVLLRRYCDICNKFARALVRFGDTIVQYCVAPDLDNCSLPSSSIHCHNVLRFEVLLVMLVLE
jgi:hypothetical protein